MTWIPANQNKSAGVRLTTDRLAHQEDASTRSKRIVTCEIRVRKNSSHQVHSVGTILPVSNPLPGLLQAIIEEPESDHLRLVYADALEESGERERAEFVRIQVELACLVGDGKRCYACNWPISLDGRGCKPRDCSYRPSERSSDHDSWLKRQKHFHELCRRERELLDAHGLMFLVRLLPPGLRGLHHAQTGPGTISIMHASFRSAYVFRRGFVEAMTCEWQDFSKFGSDIRKQTPLIEVVLTTDPPDPMTLLTADGIPGACWVEQSVTMSQMPFAEYAAKFYPRVKFTRPNERIGALPFTAGPMWFRMSEAPPEPIPDNAEVAIL